MPSRRFQWLLLWLLILTAGCQTGGNNSIKTRGVYTTLLTPESTPAASLDLPASAYVQRQTFGPNETPLAVIVGCDGYRVTLELDDLSKGNVLFAKDIDIGAGMASLQPLTISHSGQYKVRVLVGNSEMDAFTFSVEREAVITADGKPDYDAIISRLNLIMGPDFKDPDDYLARAVAYGWKKEYDNAIADCTVAIGLRPYDPKAYACRGLFHLAKADWNGALLDWNEYIRRQPDDPQGFYERGRVFEKTGDFQRAIQDVQKAMQVFPEDMHGTNALSDEIIDFNEQIPGLFLNFKNLLSYDRLCNSLAWLLATCPDASLRDGKKAVDLATEACGLTNWKSFGFVDTLAAACAETGDFDAAIKYEKLCVQQADPNSRDYPLFQQRLALYQQHLAYHQHG